MNHRINALAVVAAVAVLAGCSMFDKSSSNSETASAAPPQTTPSASQPLTPTSPVEGGASQATAPSTAASAAIALTEVENPKQTLVGATLKDAKGESVGEVKSVRVAKDGKVASVGVTVGKRTIALKPDTLSYVQAENTVVSQLSKAELQKLR
jgi:hypothetical protein